MITINKKENCCGCTACRDSCPTNSITLQQDEEGFFYPCINISSCIECDICRTVCPIIHQNGIEQFTTREYAAQSKNFEERVQCTAGGITSTIARFFFDSGTKIYGVGYDNMVVSHFPANSVDDLNCFRGSKYVQSTLNQIYKSIKQDLKNGSEVLFIGTPCQAHALFNIVGTNKNLYIIDLLCLGVSSPKLYSKWVEYLEKKNGAKVRNIEFRNKSYGYSIPNVRVTLENGKIIQQKYESRVHNQLFFMYYNVRPSCYECLFREIPRISDFTVGDFADISDFVPEYDDDIGTTHLWVHTEKGKKVIKKMHNEARMRILKEDSTNIIGGSRKQITKPIDRENFFIDSNQMSYIDFVRKWKPITAKDCLAGFVTGAILHLPSIALKKRIISLLRDRRSRGFEKSKEQFEKEK